MRMASTAERTKAECFSLADSLTAMTFAMVVSLDLRRWATTRRRTSSQHRRAEAGRGRGLSVLGWASLRRLPSITTVSGYSFRSTAVPEDMY